MSGRKWAGRKHERGCPLLWQRAEYFDALLVSRWRIAVLNNRRLTFPEKGTALVLSTWMDNNDGFTTGRAKRIARDAGYDVSSFWRHLDALKEAGFLWTENYPGRPTEFQAEIPEGSFPECTCRTDATTSRTGATPLTHERVTPDALVRHQVLEPSLGKALEEKELPGDSAGGSRAFLLRECFVCAAPASSHHGGQFYCQEHLPSRKAAA